MSPINILLVDDHLLFGRSLKIALDDYEEVETFEVLQNIEEIVSTIQRKSIDIILLDINLGNMSDKDGLQVAKEILQVDHKVKIVILTGYDLPVYSYEAKKIGVKGFLNKDILPDQLLKLLIHINEGYSYFSTEVQHIEELTTNEKKILQLLCEGYKRKEIAVLMFVSERTISNHIQHIFDKLQVSSALEAVTKGIKLGYVQANYKGILDDKMSKEFK